MKVFSYKYNCNFLYINVNLSNLFYYQNLFKNQGTKLIPDDPSTQAQVLQQMYEVCIFEFSDFEEICLVVLYILKKGKGF